MAKLKKCRKAGLCPKVNGQLSLDLAEVNIVEEWKNTSKKKLTVIDLFAGCGGASCGFEMAGIEVIAGLDFDQPACKSYCNNYRNYNSYCRYVHWRSIIRNRITGHINLSR